MLFEKEIKGAQEKLYKKSYYVSNMSEPYNDCYEVSDENNNIMIDDLSVAQLIQLSNMIWQADRTTIQTRGGKQYDKRAIWKQYQLQNEL